MAMKFSYNIKCKTECLYRIFCTIIVY